MLKCASSATSEIAEYYYLTFRASPVVLVAQNWELVQLCLSSNMLVQLVCQSCPGSVQKCHKAVGGKKISALNYYSWRQNAYGYIELHTL